jgi:ubiquinone/menaquinone biosynthesis C-methylase UbiE
MQFHSQDGARRYQDTLVPLMFAPSARKLVAAARLPAGAHVLDIATGTGIVARTAAEVMGPSGRVTALDMTEGMLAVAEEESSVPGAAPIEYLLAAVEDAPLPDAAFHAAFCQQGLQFFEDPVRALERVRAALRNDGRLHIALWGALEDHPLAASIQRALLDSGLDELTGFLYKAHSLHDQVVVRDLLEKAGFRVEREESADITPDGTWHANDGPRMLAASPMCTRLDGVSEEQRATLSRALKAQFHRYEHDGKLDLHFAAIFYAAVPA